MCIVSVFNSFSLFWTALRCLFSSNVFLNKFLKLWNKFHMDFIWGLHFRDINEFGKNCMVTLLTFLKDSSKLRVYEMWNLFPFWYYYFEKKWLWMILKFCYSVCQVYGWARSSVLLYFTACLLMMEPAFEMNKNSKVNTIQEFQI